MSSRPLLLLIGACSIVGFGALSAGTAYAETSRGDAVRRCNQQRGCKVIHEQNGDVVILVDDVDGDGQGGGVIRCPAGTTTCTQMRKAPAQSKTPHRKDVPAAATR
ncbi:MAG: hypothetical protein ACREE0_04565 [Phenylobacterium sp.]